MERIHGAKCNKERTNEEKQAKREKKFICGIEWNEMQQINDGSDERRSRQFIQFEQIEWMACKRNEGMECIDWVKANEMHEMSGVG